MTTGIPAGARSAITRASSVAGLGVTITQRKSTLGGLARRAGPRRTLPEGPASVAAPGEEQQGGRAAGHGHLDVGPVRTHPGRRRRRQSRPGSGGPEGSGWRGRAGRPVRRSSRRRRIGRPAAWPHGSKPALGAGSTRRARHVPICPGANRSVGSDRAGRPGGGGAVGAVGIDVVGGLALDGAGRGSRGRAARTMARPRPAAAPGRQRRRRRAPTWSIVATPWEGVLTTVAPLEEALAGKIVISMANALTRWGQRHGAAAPADRAR